MSPRNGPGALAGAHGGRVDIAETSRSDPNNPKSVVSKALARCGLSIHPACDAFPMLDGKDLQDLAADMEKNGLRNPLCLWRSMSGAPWQVVDGQNRIAAMLRLLNGEELLAGAIATAVQHEADDDPVALAVTLNLQRRHLDQRQRRDLVAQLLKASPPRSDRQIAVLAKASPTTVGAIRVTLEHGGMVSNLDTRVGKDGVAQPAAKQRREPERPAAPDRQQDFRRANLPPIVQERERAPAATVPATPAISQPDAQDIETTRRRITLALPVLLRLDPIGGLAYVAAVISGAKLPETIAKNERVDVARKILRALGVSEADLLGGKF